MAAAVAAVAVAAAAAATAELAVAAAAGDVKSVITLHCCRTAMLLRLWINNIRLIRPPGPSRVAYYIAERMNVKSRPRTPPSANRLIRF